MRHDASLIPLLFASWLAIWLPGCRRAEMEEASEPEVQMAVEGGVRLTEDAVARIGIVTTPVEARPIPSTMSMTGWLVVEPGHETTVNAPATGFVIPQEGVKPVALGNAVTAGSTLATLQVFLSPQEEAQLVAMKEEVDILIRQSLASLKTAEARLERINTLSQNGTVPGKELQLAKEAVDRAKATYEETQQQLPFLPAEPYEHPLRLNAVTIESPMSGRITELHAHTRQLVVQGDPLWTLSDWSSLWIRVPVFEGDLPAIDRALSATVSKPGLESTIPAEPTNIPQPTEDGRRTVDLFYEVANPNGVLRPGEAVSVELPTGKTGEQVVLPKSAILWDSMANSWVYVQDEKNVFHRQKIRLGPSSGDVFVVEHGLLEGQSVVTVGVEALYGEEFKGQIQVLEDDD